MKRALFVTYGGGHSAIIRRLVAQAPRMGYEAHVLALTVAAQQFTDLDCKVYGFRHFCEDDKWCRDVLVRYGLEKEVQRHPAVPEGETEAYLAMSFSDLVAECGDEQALRRYKDIGRRSFLPRLTLRRIIKEIEPDLVVATSAPRAERAAIDAAGELGIPSVCVVDLFAVVESEWVARPGFASAVCVLSESVRDFLVSCGRRPDDIHVTGNPAFDDLFQKATLEQAERIREINGWSDKKVVFWAAPSVIRPVHPVTGERTDPALPAKVEAELVELSKRYGDQVKIVFRPHPTTPSDKLEQLPPEIYLSDSRESVDHVLLASDLVVVTNSTVGVMASLCAKPVIAVYVPGYTEAGPLAKMGFATHADDERHMAALVECWLAQKPEHRWPDPSGSAGEATRQVWDVCKSVTD